MYYLEFPEATHDQKFEQIRLERNRRLVASDWAMTLDAPTDKTAWATYRQQLRDFPSTWTPGPEANFPQEPTQ